MAAAHFPLGSVSSAAEGIDPQWLATTILLLTFAILILKLMLTRFSVTQLNGQIVRLATFDTLTDLPNRWTLTEQIKRAISSHRRNTFAILFMDLDGFKVINDSLGHSAGDEILKAFAQRFLHCVRGGDTVARLGGDEFVVLLENLGSPDDAAKMAESVLDRMRQSIWVDNQPIQVMPSIGISLFPQDGETVEALLKHADAARYEAKRGGRSTYRFFEVSMNEAATRILQIQRALH